MTTYLYLTHDAWSGAVLGVAQQIDNIQSFVAVNGHGWDDFLAWNNQQTPPWSLAPIAPTARVRRPLWAIRADVQALSVGQFNNVWNDLSAAVSGQAPRKYLMDYGSNAGAIFVFDWSLYVTGPTAAQVKAGQISLTAMYVQDNPTYLVNPPFDTSINVPGDQPP